MIKLPSYKCLQKKYEGHLKYYTQVCQDYEEIIRDLVEQMLDAGVKPKYLPLARGEGDLPTDVSTGAVMERIMRFAMLRRPLPQDLQRIKEGETDKKKE